jgi:hypothetical protein
MQRYPILLGALSLVPARTVDLLLPGRFFLLTLDMQQLFPQFIRHGSKPVSAMSVRRNCPLPVLRAYTEGEQDNTRASVERVG